MYQTGKSLQVAREMQRFGIDILALQETRWISQGQTKLSSGETVLFSGHTEEDAAHTEGVAFMVSKKAEPTIMEWEPISGRFCKMRLMSKGRPVTIINCYAPINDADEEVKSVFYERLQQILDASPKRDIKVVLGDMNAKVGDDNTGKELQMGTHGLGEMSENGEMFSSFCAFNDLVIGGTLFPHKKCHKVTWTSPTQTTENQIDHITISRKWRRSMLDVRVKRSADVGTDHHLLVGTFRLKLARSIQNQQSKRNSRYNVQILKKPEIKTQFVLELQNKYEALAQQDIEAETVEEKWNRMKQIFDQTSKEVLGNQKKEHKEWMSEPTWQLINERRKIKANILAEQNQCKKAELQKEYSNKDKDVKRSTRKDKRDFVENLAEQAEAAAMQGDMKTLYEVTRKLTKKNNNQDRPIKDKEGNTITKEEDKLRRWAEHFQDVLNREPPEEEADIEEGAALPVNTNNITEEEVKKAIKQLKSGKAPGSDNIQAEVLKADINITAKMLHPLINQIWEEEMVPGQWREGLLVKLPKKGDLSKCENYRGITLLSLPSKVLTRIMLERLRDAVDKKLRNEQAGSRKGRSCNDQITTLRIIIEQSIEWQSSLYLNFVDFEKAFDSISRDVMWKLMRHYGIPEKFVNITRNLYQGFTCRVIHGNKLTEPFNVNSGVRQGCILSPTLFLLAVDYIMKTVTENRKTGIQWTLMTQLEDLDYVDDICLLSHRLRDIQDKTTRLEETARKIGLKVNAKKTKVMRINNKAEEEVHLQGQDLEDVDDFTYLGSVVSKDGGADKDIKQRLGKARQAFNMLRPIWKASTYSKRTKIKIFKSNVKSVLLYGAESWKMTEGVKKKLQTFINKCLRHILRVTWPQKITNQELWARTQEENIDLTIRRRRWKWLGHTLRKPHEHVIRQALDWNPQGKRKRGRPKETWRRTLDKEIKMSGKTWATLKKSATNRVRWRSLVTDLCSTGSEED